LVRKDEIILLFSQRAPLFGLPVPAAGRDMSMFIRRSCRVSSVELRRSMLVSLVLLWVDHA
jgi:hypothetical protein